MEMSQIIKTRRKELDLTLEQVGKFVGVGKSTVRKWENGDIENMRRDKIAALAEVLQVSINYLMGWDEEKPTADMDGELSEKLNWLLSIVDTLTEEEWQKLMDYAALILNARPNRKDGL